MSSAAFLAIALAAAFGSGWFAHAALVGYRRWRHAQQPLQGSRPAIIKRAP